MCRTDVPSSSPSFPGFGVCGGRKNRAGGFDMRLVDMLADDHDRAEPGGLRALLFGDHRAILRELLRPGAERAGDDRPVRRMQNRRAGESPPAFGVGECGEPVETLDLRPEAAERPTDRKET